MVNQGNSQKFDVGSRVMLCSGEKLTHLKVGRIILVYGNSESYAIVYKIIVRRDASVVEGGISYRLTL